VVARRGADWAAYQPKRGGAASHGRSATRRHYNIALDIPGAELRLPALPDVHFGWRAVSGLMVVMLLACLYFLWSLPVFRVDTVAADGLQRLTVGDLNAVLGLFDQSIFSIDPAQVELMLGQAFPEFSAISVQLGLPASVHIRVVERQPVLAWLQDGRELWIDAEGVAFPPRGNPGTLVRVEARSAPAGFDPAAVLETGGFGNLPYLLPQAAGDPSLPQRRNTIDPALVTSILAISPQVPPETLLIYDAEHGLGWRDPRGWDAYFGAQPVGSPGGYSSSAGDMAARLVVYQALVERLEAEGVQPAFISVEYLHAPFFRMER
jgi:cell division protein FtsQ